MNAHPRTVTLVRPSLPGRFILASYPSSVRHPAYLIASCLQYISNEYSSFSGNGNVRDIDLLSTREKRMDFTANVYASLL